MWCRNETTTIKKYRNYENYYLHNSRNLDGFKTKCSKEQKEVCEKRQTQKKREILMATLETQYRNYLLENPNSQITFEDWKTDILMSPIKVVLKDIDKKLKQDFLRAKGWSTVWHDDNWVDNRNPDLAGTTLDKAYQYAKENLDLYM